jgi:hypothetical protein
MTQLQTTLRGIAPGPIFLAPMKGERQLVDLDDAIEQATKFSDESDIAQTVYSVGGSWKHTNPFANLLQSHRSFMTVLPPNYFR